MLVVLLPEAFCEPLEVALPVVLEPSLPVALAFPEDSAALVGEGWLLDRSPEDEAESRRVH